MRLSYRGEDGNETERTVWPVVLGYADTKRVLIAWCELRQGFRHFRTDRILAVKMLHEKVHVRRADLYRRWQTWRASELGEPPRGP